jgi:hypothetical protein
MDFETSLEGLLGIEVSLLYGAILDVSKYRGFYYVFFTIYSVLIYSARFLPLGNADNTL